MRVVGLSEGARVDSGGVGIVVVPDIHEALSLRGHRVALAISGPPMASALPYMQNRLECAIDAPEESSMAAVSFGSIGRWSYSPALARSVARVAPRTDFFAMHSVFSYPVLVGYRMARRFSKPYGIWLHGVLAPVQRRVGHRRKAVYNSLVGRDILNSASVLFFSAAGERDEARDLGLTAPSVIIPHGVHAEAFAQLPPREQFRQERLGGWDGPLVLFLGRLNAKKGLDLLADAIGRVRHQIRDVKVVIAGTADPPTFLTDVRRWFEAANAIDATVFTGLLTGRDKLAALAACDVFVMPSVAENFGMSLFEAMASARAVVCSDTINYAETIRERDAGIPVPRRADALAHAIGELLQDPARRAAVAANGLQLAREFTWAANSARVEMAIQCVIERQPFPACLNPA